MVKHLYGTASWCAPFLETVLSNYKLPDIFGYFKE